MIRSAAVNDESAAQDERMYWHVYLRWATGRRETVVCQGPRPVLPPGGCHLLASMPVPSLTVLPLASWHSQTS
jgi:hypothetical protein